MTNTIGHSPLLEINHKPLLMGDSNYTKKAETQSIMNYDNSLIEKAHDPDGKISIWNVQGAAYNS